MKVAIDGPAGSGKSTVAHALAQQYGLTLLDTGAMYRSVTYVCLSRSIDVGDAEAVSRVAQEIHISFSTDAEGNQTVFVDGEDVTRAIRTAEVDASVSAVAAIPAVREAMVAQQRRIACEGDVVAEGRDIGTVVFPDAEVKVFLTADPSQRAHRRALQRNIIDSREEEAILQDLKRRDEADSTREVAPLRPAEDARHIDSTSLTIEEEVARIGELIDAARVQKEAALPENPNPQAKVESNESKAHAEPEVEQTEAKKPKDDQDQAMRDGRMRVFGHHEPEEYYEHPIREYPLTSRALLAVAVGACGALSKLLWPWKVENGDALWKAPTGQMVVVNHCSMLDPVLVVVTDWAHGRRIRPIYKSEFDDHKLVSWFFARIGGIPVQRGKADVKAVRRAQRALQRGEDVLVFPEGTRVYSDDQEVTIHGGFALMAQLAKVPVLPIGVVGARDGVPGGNKPLRPHRVYLRVGDALTFDELGVKGRKKQAKAMEERAMSAVYALRDALRAAHPGKM